MLTYHEAIKNYVEVLAILSAGAAIIYWYFQGSLHPGMNVKLEASRDGSNDSEHHFVNVLMCLSNPGRVSLALELIEFRLIDISGTVVKSKTYFPRRCDISEYSVTWNDLSSPAHPINLARGDAIHLGHIFDGVNPRDAYVVEALAVAANPNLPRPVATSRTMQWRVSVGLLPKKADEPSGEPEPPKTPVVKS